MAPGPTATRSILPSGIPCWVELATLDEEATHRFYSGLFGWSFHVNRDPATANGRYLIASLAGRDVAGSYLAAAGQTSLWTINISVHSTANAAEWTEHLGGRVTLGPVAIPNRGSILHVTDPAGAPAVFWQPASTWDFVSGVPNTFANADLNTHHGDAADGFFCRLFNYTSRQIGDNRGVDYVEWCLDLEPVLYRYVMGPEYPADTVPHWMVYFDVDPARGTDATAGHALMLGGRIVVEPYDSPWGRIAIIADPCGAVFSVIDRGVIDEDFGRAEVDDPYDD
ncbi:VOC family protein [Amycolatopsis alkalitolerans]|uniref:VOC family protein n=1 Tax=Amycolatopsis alkalitolerans TaxID=2547244 RepID=A0A5C4LTV0_9PSEU|nr:VOC family protein [Amycolatopsis alkalitolerans]TNC22537.1 VOC family protein [Amycolatopsis alkalitolerans]